MKSKTFNIVIMIVSWLCAGVWWFNVVLDVTKTASVYLKLHIVCAAIWTVLSIVLTFRAKHSDEE